MNYPAFYPTLPARALASVFRNEATLPFRVDVEEDDQQFSVVADLPGVRKENVEIQMEKNTLSITATSKRTASESNGKTARMRERFVGEYTRRFALPEGIDAQGINAEMKDGVLTVLLPKTPEAAAQRITVK